MRRELIERLSCVSPEEEAILRGESVDMRLYDSTGGAVLRPGRILPEGRLFGVRTHTRFAPFPRHSHTYVEMVYQVTGSTSHIIGGQEELALPAGSLLLLGRGVEHGIMAASREDVAVNFILVPEFFDSAAISLGGGNALSVFLKNNLVMDDASGTYLMFNVSGDPAVENLLENLVLLELDGRDPGRQELQRMTLELLLRHLSAKSEEIVVSGRGDRERAAVLRALGRIESDVHVTLTGLAAEEGMSPSTLTRVLRRHTGSGFTELVQTARFNRAVALLTETDLSISDVALAVGYENTAFFYRRFNTLYGLTPAQYRRERRKQTAGRL